MRLGLSIGTLMLVILASMPALARPLSAQPTRQTVESCTEAAFDRALQDVQAAGGGRIEFSCSEAITFTTPKAITSAVTLIGDGQLVLDGNDSVRLFEVAEGAALELVGLTVTNGHAVESSGGAIDNRGSLTLTASTFSGNEADRYGGVINNEGGSVTITASTFTGNHAGDLGGVLYNINGTTTISASTFSDNSARFDGGVLKNDDGSLEVTASSFTDNRSQFGSGGVIANGGTGTLTATASTFAGNYAGLSGGVVSTFGPVTVTASTFSLNSARIDGGAISNDGTSEIVASTFDGNSSGDDGGAIHHSGFNDLTIVSSTFSENRAVRFGGAIYGFETSSPGELTIVASTFRHNASDNGGGIYSDMPTTIQASILIADPSDINCFGVFAPGPDSDPRSGGYNLSSDTSCAFDRTGDRQGASILFALGPLQDNGGPTRTMLPGQYSAAREAIPSAACAQISSATDQRGVPRLQGSRCEIGAVEVGPVPVQIVAFESASAMQVPEGSPASLLVVATGPPGAALESMFDCDGDGAFETGGSVDGNTATGSCGLPDEGQHTVDGSVCADTGGPAPDCATDTLELTGFNVAPSINAISTGPIIQGQPVAVTVAAGDPGPLDQLSFSFDCAGDGIYELGPQADGSATCDLDPARATTAINVLVDDGDGGQATGSVSVSQAAAICGNRVTGVLTAPLTDGSCPEGTLLVMLPAPDSTTLCINPYTNALNWSPRGECGAGYRVHAVPDAGPLNYCQSIYTGKLRYSASGSCSAGERPGVIPA